MALFAARGVLVLSKRGFSLFKRVGMKLLGSHFRELVAMYLVYLDGDVFGFMQCLSVSIGVDSSAVKALIFPPTADVVLPYRVCPGLRIPLSLLVMYL
jgi:hypothetical protein